MFKLYELDPILSDLMKCLLQMYRNSKENKLHLIVDLVLNNTPSHVSGLEVVSTLNK